MKAGSASLLKKIVPLVAGLKTPRRLCAAARLASVLGRYVDRRCRGRFISPHRAALLTLVGGGGVRTNLTADCFGCTTVVKRN